MSVTVDDVEVTEADIDEQVEALRDRFATITPVERAAADGDSVSIDLTATVDGEVLDEATTEGLTYTVGAGDLVDGIDDAITGLSAGESATFTTVLVAGGFAGREAEVTVTVQSVSERALPEVDEDFAQLASEFDTVEELRADLAEKIRRVKNRTQAAEARDKVLEALLEVTDIPTPECIVDAEFKSREHDAVHAFDHDEDALTAHVISQGQTREEFDAEIREGAVKSVKVQLLLDALAEANEVGVNQEEFTERVMFNSQRLGIAPDEYFSRLQEGNQLASVFAEVRRGKALAAAVEQATVTNASGEVLDVAALFGIEADDEAEELAAELLAEEMPRRSSPKRSPRRSSRRRLPRRSRRRSSRRRLPRRSPRRSSPRRSPRKSRKRSSPRNWSRRSRPRNGRGMAEEIDELEEAIAEDDEQANSTGGSRPATAGD